MTKSELLNKVNIIKEHPEEKKCIACNGTGEIEGCCFKESCHACGGKGWIAENENVL
ncbi:MAG: Tryptophan RNA-binding attenuator protein inhibitory protein [Thermoproteota archaeon]|nr:Tryptophan RNA-binding attenuator protein inhibitory protein [Thermoproteota archaeon]